MLNLTLFAYNNKKKEQYLTKEINVSSIDEFEIGYQTFLFTIPYEKIYFDVIANNDTLSDEEKGLYKKIVEIYC